MTRSMNWTNLPVILRCFLLLLTLLISPKAVRISRTALTASGTPRGTERTFNLLNERDSNIFYLKEELELDDKTMMNIIRKHSWVLYLDVESNLIPTIEALSDSGFTLDDIRRLVAKVPSILGIDSVWTIPEKLLSLQHMFYLNSSHLCDVIIEQPMLLTSSIDRNYEVASFLSDKIGLLPKEITQIMTSSKLGPTMAMTSYAVLSLSWSLLTTDYGLTPTQAKKLVKSYPNVLSHRFLDYHAERVKFLEILGVPLKSELCIKLILKNPKILVIDASYFLFSNYETICESLASLSTDKITKMLCIHPQLLTLHPLTLFRSCNFNMYLLTGINKFRNLAVGEGDWSDDFDDNDDDDGYSDNSGDEEEYEDGSISYTWEKKSLTLLSRILEDGNDDDIDNDNGDKGGEKESIGWADMTSRQKRDERRAKLLMLMSSSSVDSDVMSQEPQQHELQELDLIHDIVRSFQRQQNHAIRMDGQSVYEKDVVKQLDRHAIQKNSERILNRNNYQNTSSSSSLASKILSKSSARNAPLLWQASSRASQQLSSAFFKKAVVAQREWRRLCRAGSLGERR